LRLRREIDELKSRDLEASRRWSEQQAQLASFASRVKELELQLARQVGQNALSWGDREQEEEAGMGEQGRKRIRRIVHLKILLAVGCS